MCLDMYFISRDKMRICFRRQTFKSPVAAALVRSPPSAILILFLMRLTAGQNICHYFPTSFSGLSPRSEALGIPRDEVDYFLD